MFLCRCHMLIRVLMLAGRLWQRYWLTFQIFPSLAALEAQTLDFWRPVLQVDDVLRGVLHILQHPTHYLHLPGEILGSLLAVYSQDFGYTTPHQDYHWLHLAGRSHQRSAGIGHGWSGGCGG